MRIHSLKWSDGRCSMEYEYDYETEIKGTIGFSPYKSGVGVTLNPCPFCGVIGTLNQSNKGWYGWCSVCGAEGPKHWDWEIACKLWNANSLTKHFRALDNPEGVNKLFESGFDRSRVVNY